MRILVYGAGVLGSYLAHVLIRGGNDVTLLARGERLKELQANGLVIRHYVQLKTTVDPVRLIDALAPEDVYDLIFVVMQYTQLRAILPALSANRSSHIVLVGNNADAQATQRAIQENSPVQKQVAFGFQGTGGRREAGRVICVRAAGHMSLGGLSSELSWKSLVDKAFSNTKYRLTYYGHMDTWLKGHIALILPLCYLAHFCDGNLHKAFWNKKLLNRVIDAVDEGYGVLETLGYPLSAEDAAFARKKRGKFYLMLKVVTATPIGRLAISDHAMSALEEMTALNGAFAALKRQAGIPTPNWDALEAYLKKPDHHVGFERF
ncbi:MAG: 2-dehydropantoate 2-reductase N-terminal domain-containing protein [Bacillota bacterium]